MTLGIALLGAGRIGQVHADAVAACTNATLISVTDIMAPAAMALAERHDCQVRALDDIAGASNVDAVIIATPTPTHADLIERFARVGKAVFCEKPIDLNLDRVRACLSVVADTQTTLMVGFNRRFDPHIGAVRAAIEAGEVGTVEMVQITSRDPGAPPPDYIRSSGGIFRDMTIHDFDLARFMLGEEIETVCATASVLTDPAIADLDDFDSVSVILTTKTGRHCTISNSRRATYGYDQRVEVHGSKGMVSVKNQRPLDIEIATASGYVRPPLHDFFMTRYTQAYEAEIAAFVKCVQTGSRPSPDGNDGLMALALAEAALQSVTGGRQIPVSQILEPRP
ncbi:MAG: inositol 2-dehydrogenase [Alphaproteobacteria bacterium]|nr:inositol 2-dehydrogenase [Alphaproteobacteria bacterium]